MTETPRKADGSSIGARLAALARLSPDAPCLIGGNGRLVTRGELAARTVAVAQHAGPGAPIILVTGRGPEAAIALLGLAERGPVLPVPASMPANEIAALAAAAGAIHLAGIAETSKIAGTLALEADLTPMPLDGLPTSNSDVGAMPDDAAFILPTSGTTGRPKLVAQTHAAFGAAADSVAKVFALTEEDCGLNAMPLFHIHGLSIGLIAPLLVGSRVVLPDGPDPDTFLALAARYGATWYSAVPTLHNAIAAAAEADPDAARACRFRIVRSASSALPKTVRDRLEALFGTPVLEGFGMTEGCSWITQQAPGRSAPHGSVGWPDRLEIEIRDSDGTALPPGSEGEIMIRGPHAVTGYFNVQDDGADAEGWLATGDLGRLDETGALWIVARRKEMIKRAGFNISPHAVEDLLLARPGVAEAVAFGVDHPTMGQDLAAGVVAAPGAILSEADLRQALLARCDGTLVPSRILLLDELPKGPSGKLRRVSLQHDLADHLSPPSGTPRNDMEALIHAIFTSVLPGPSVSIHDDFFMAGGDSLAAMRVLSQIRGTLGHDLSPVTFLGHPTPASLARYLSQVDGGALVDLLNEAAGDIAKEPS